MTDLASRLRVAITARLELAREAEAINLRGYYYVNPDARFSDEQVSVVSEFWDVVTEPEWTIRACERDLRVLDRHALVHDAGDDECKTCLTDLGVFGDQAVPVAWPCPEIRDLASVYSVEVEA